MANHNNLQKKFQYLRNSKKKYFTLKITAFDTSASNHTLSKIDPRKFEYFSKNLS